MSAEFAGIIRILHECQAIYCGKITLPYRVDYDAPVSLLSQTS